MGDQHRKRKSRWFELGAAHFADCFPDVLAVTPQTSKPVYACPLCAREEDGGIRIKLHTRASLAPGADDRLTAEDVPPRSVGGSPLVLTCWTCNNTAGNTIDRHVAAAERSASFLEGHGELEGHVRLGTHELPAHVSVKASGAARIRLKPAPSDVVRRFHEHLNDPTADRTIHLRGQTHDPGDPRVKISWLKSAYLAMFAMFGYRYAFSDNLELVRRQIQQPTTVHIEHFAVRLPVQYRALRPRAFRVPTSDDVPASFGVIVGRHMVFLPYGDAADLYGSISEIWGTGRTYHIEVANSFWPHEPNFAFADRIEISRGTVPGGTRIIPGG